MTGHVNLLNVGDGDTKLTFDNKNPAETIRASRICKDMIRRGYALLVEVDQPDGTKAFQRAMDFDETKNEYIIADYDPLVAFQPIAAVNPVPTPAVEITDGSPPTTRPETTGETNEEAGKTASADQETSGAEEERETAAPRARVSRSGATRRVSALRTRAVAVARSAGG